MVTWTHEKKREARTAPAPDKQNIDQAYSQLFRSETGREVLNDLIRQCEFPHIREEDINYAVGTYKEGKRKMVQYILDKIEKGNE